MKSCSLRACLVGVLLFACGLLPGDGFAASSSQQLSTTNDTNYQTALAAIDAQDYNTALVYLNQALTTNSNNGYVYLTRAKLDLLYYLPSNAVSDATNAVRLLRSSSTCDQFLPSDSPLLLNATASYSSFYGGLTSPYSGYGSILNLTNIGVPTTSTTGTTTTGTSTTGTTTTGTTTTGTTTNGTTTTGTTTGTSTTGTTTTTGSSSSTFASSSGSQKLPVAEDLTEKEKKENETMNQYNKTATQMAMYTAFCGGIYLNNKSSLIEGYNLLGKAYLLGLGYANSQKGFAAALALDDQNATATAGLGLAYLGQGASSAALSELNLAVTYAPEQADVYVARGAYWVSVGDSGRANEEYDTAVALDAAYLPAYASLGLLRSLQGNYQSALEAFDKALAINANYVVALLGRAAAWSGLAAATTDASQAATYQQNAANDQAQAQKLQGTVTTAASATSTSSWYPPTTITNTTYSSLYWYPVPTTSTSTTSSTTSTLTTPTIGTFY